MLWNFLKQQTKIKQKIAKTMARAEKIPEEDTNNDSDVELEGMDLEGDDGDADDSGDVDMEEGPVSAAQDTAAEDEATDKLAHEDQDELEAAHRERKELMLMEQKEVAAPDTSNASMGDKLQYLIAQSDVFAHFLAGSMAASDKKKKGKKGGSRGKKNRMTEAEEDAQLLKTAESKRSVIRLNKQVQKKWRVLCLEFTGICLPITMYLSREIMFISIDESQQLNIVLLVF